MGPNPTRLFWMFLILSISPLRSLDGLLFPASPLDWDSLTDPEYLFAAAPPETPPPGQCRSLIHGFLNGKPVSWEVTVDLRHLWSPEGQEITSTEGSGEGEEEGRKSWEELLHQLTARSAIRDFEKMAENEGVTGHGDRFSILSNYFSHFSTIPNMNIFMMEFCFDFFR